MSVTPEARPAWYLAQPERLAWELAEFEARGLPAELYETHDARKAVRTALPFKGEEVEIQIAFPFDYPDVEPTAYGPAGLLTRHQTRQVGNFCLLENPALDWWPTMSAAQLVDEDLRWLLDDATAGPEAVAAGEADWPEPISQHIDVTPDRVALVPEPFWALELHASAGNIVLYDAAFGGDNQILASAEGIGDADQKLIDHFEAGKGERHAGRWVALPDDALKPWPTHQEILGAALAADSGAVAKLRRTLAQDRKRQRTEGWLAVTFREEGPHRGEWRRAWSLLWVRLDRGAEPVVVRALRAQALTTEERTRRIPELAGLSVARMLVVGAGSLGAPLVMELAKAGVGHITIADFDRYDVNNAVRHVLEPRWAGTPKALALAIEAEQLNPFVKVTPRQLKIGRSPGDSQLLDALLADTDLVIDATGSQIAARVLQRRCHEFEKPLLLVSLTAGSFGGEVALFRPASACYWCFVLGQDDGTVPRPAEGPRSTVSPVGCHGPAFSGAGFDATALAQVATRTAVRATGHSTYPPLDYDYVICNFRGSDPWRQGQLAPHSGCPLSH